jgi:hypothetical protein
VISTVRRMLQMSKKLLRVYSRQDTNPATLCPSVAAEMGGVPCPGQTGEQICCGAAHLAYCDGMFYQYLECSGTMEEGPNGLFYDTTTRQCTSQ